MDATEPTEAEDKATIAEYDRVAALVKKEFGGDFWDVARRMRERHTELALAHSQASERETHRQEERKKLAIVEAERERARPKPIPTQDPVQAGTVAFENEAKCIRVNFAHRYAKPPAVTLQTFARQDRPVALLVSVDEAGFTMTTTTVPRASFVAWQACPVTQADGIELIKN